MDPKDTALYAISCVIGWAFLGTNVIHDFTAVTFSVKLASFREKTLISVKSVIFFVNFNTYLHEGFRVLSAAFVQILLFATCHT